jgi:hypothetical protein
MAMLQFYLVFLCALLFWEDLRHRAVHWSLLAQAFLCFGVLGLLTQGRRAFLAEVPVNLGFVLLQYVGVTLYCSLRARRWTNPFHAHTGAGDLLFLLASALLFPRHVFVFFVISGIVFALAGYGVLRLVMPKQPATVPAAGLMALYLGTWFALGLSGALDTTALNQWLAHA